MSKALLRQHAEKAIRERNEQEQAYIQKARAAQQQAPVLATVHIQTVQPVTVTQKVVLSDNKAIEEAAKARQHAERLQLENDRMAQEREKLALEKEALKTKIAEDRIQAAQEQARADIEEQVMHEQLENNIQQVRRVSQENELLKEELARLKQDNEEKKASNKALSQVLDVEETARAENLVAPPPVYDEEAHVLVLNNDAPISNDIEVTGETNHEKADNNCSVM